MGHANANVFTWWACHLLWMDDAKLVCLSVCTLIFVMTHFARDIDRKFTRPKQHDVKHTQKTFLNETNATNMDMILIYLNIMNSRFSMG